MPRILGVSASLRNIRFGRASAALCDDIRQLTSADGVYEYVSTQTKLAASVVFKEGKLTGAGFDEAYQRLRSARTDRGLSNSEGALVAALWGAHSAGAEISHCGVARFFPASGAKHRLSELRETIFAADGIVLSGPVYFGDRGSLAQEFIDFVRNDRECAEHLRGKVYAGVAVGAKRNGGQETTLIYQMVDFTTLGMLAVGNDTETTSQYGGTAVAGDVGTLGGDKQGMLTAIGTGRRVAKVAQQLAGRASDASIRIAIWVLQDDRAGHFRLLIDRLTTDVAARVPNAEFVVHEMTREEVYRCIACDLCPTRDGPPEEYRCIVTAEDDLFQKHHVSLLGADAVLLAAYSPVDRHNIRSVYQRVIERTRYLRRDSYLFSNITTAPLVVSEINSNQNLHIRMLTSFVRHHTVLHRPIIGIEQNGEVLNYDHMSQQAVEFALHTARLAAGRRELPSDPTPYNPIGYVISSAARDASRRGASVE